MMGVLNALKLSLSLPSKKAVFQLNRIKTKDFFLYIVFLHILLGLPGAVSMLIEFLSKGELDGAFLLGVTLYPFLIVTFGIVGISLLATIGLLIRTVTQRRLVYQLLWKMAMYASTTPIIVYTIFDLFGVMNWFVNVVLFAWFLFTLTSMVLVYPKRMK